MITYCNYYFISRLILLRFARRREREDLEGAAGGGAGVPGEDLGRRQERALRQEHACEKVPRPPSGI